MRRVIILAMLIGLTGCGSNAMTDRMDDFFEGGPPRRGSGYYQGNQGYSSPDYRQSPYGSAPPYRSGY